MLSRLLFVRLKAAENALRDGRLDEAYRLATAPDIREHRRGAAVLAALTEKFIERARNHYRADRFTEALIDLDRAETGGVMKESIAELRENVRTVAAEQERRQQSRRGRIDQAKRRIDAGSIVAGRKILEDAGESDLAADELKRKADDRSAEAQRILAQADQLASAGQMASAVQRLRRAKSLDAHNEGVTRMESRLCSQALENARAALEEGRLTRASDELNCLGDLGNPLPAKRELRNMLAIAQDMARSVQVGDYTDARRHAMSLARLLPKAGWVSEVVEQLRRIDDLKSELCSGPLGDRIDRIMAKDGGQRITAQDRGDAPAPAHKTPRTPVGDETVALAYRTRSNTSLPERLLLLVDGGGSYLILRNERVTLGRAATSKPADIPLYSDVAERHASVARVDDDFFLFTDKEVEVAGHRTPHQLLQSGDRIVLGRKAKMTFRMPSRKSPSAVLDLSDTTKMPNDVRRVVLFHQHAALGAGPSAHIRCRHAGPSLVLFERNGSLWIRQKSDGHVDTEAVQLALGEPVEIAGASLALQPWEVRTPGSGTV